MTKASIALTDLAEKGPDVDLVGDMLQLAAQRLMEIDVEALCGAAYGERTVPARTAATATAIAGRIVSVAVILAVGVNTDGTRELLGLATGPSEAEPFWTEFLRSLSRRGLRGVKLVISDSHVGLKAAIAKVFKATWQRCRVHFMRNALAHAGKGQRQMVFALINTVFAQETAEAARKQWRIVADQLREKFPKLSVMLDDAEQDVLAFMAFPKAHRKQLASTNPLERLNAEIKRRTDVVGIFPTRRRSCGSSVRCCLSRTTNGSCSGIHAVRRMNAVSDNQTARLSAVIS
jgi:putative transposase